MSSTALHPFHKRKKTTFKPTVFKQLLVGLRADDLDSKQLRYLKFFIQQVSVQAAHFLHVATEKELQSIEANLTSNFFTPKYSACSKLLQKMVHDIQKSVLPNSKIDITCDLLVGNILDNIITSIEQYQADLVTIGSKQDAKSNHLLEKELLHKTQSHLLLIPDQSRHQLRNILVPIDFSRSAADALRIAIKINKQLPSKAQLFCLYTEDAPQYLFKYDKEIEPALQKIIERETTQAFEYFLGHFPEEDMLTLNTDIVNDTYANFAPSIMEYIKEKDIDLIILGADRLGAIELVKMEQLAEQLMAINNEIPMFII